MDPLPSSSPEPSPEVVSRPGGTPHLSFVHSRPAAAAAGNTPRLSTANGTPRAPGYAASVGSGTPGSMNQWRGNMHDPAWGSGLPQPGHSHKGHKHPFVGGGIRGWVKRQLLNAGSLRTHTRFIALFIVLTSLYSALFFYWTRTHTHELSYGGGEGGYHTGGGHQGGLVVDPNDPTAMLEAHMSLAHAPASKLLPTCRECPVCPPAYESVRRDELTGAPCITTSRTADTDSTGAQCEKCAACPVCPAPTAMAAAAAAAGVASDAAPAQAPVVQPVITVQQVLGDNPIPIDSSGTVYHIRGRGPATDGANGRDQGDQYVLCSFTRVCAQHGRLLFTHHDPAQVERWKTEFAKCGAPGVEHWQQPEMCSCFHGQFKPDFLAPDQVAAAEKDGSQLYKRQHYFSVHKWVNIHHIAHWAQKLVVFAAVYQFGGSIPLPPLEGLLFHDSDLPLSEHEQVILDAALAALEPRGRHPLSVKAGREDRMIWAETLNAKQAAMEQSYALQATQAPNAPRTTDGWAHLQCFDRLTLVPHYGIFSFHPQDTLAFRREVYKSMNLPPGNRCPPRKARLLYRHNRGIINRDEIKQLLKVEFNLDLEYATVNEASTSREQVELFASTGLMLSSHSSQLINVLFSPEGGAMVEVAPEFYNADFSEYAHGMGVFFQYALGGTVPGGEVSKPQQECVDILAECLGASYCILERRYRCAKRTFPNKNMDFIANVTAVRIAVANSIQHLQWLCAGRW